MLLFSGTVVVPCLCRVVMFSYELFHVFCVAKLQTRLWWLADDFDPAECTMLCSSFEVDCSLQRKFFVCVFAELRCQRLFVCPCCWIVILDSKFSVLFPVLENLVSGCQSRFPCGISARKFKSWTQIFLQRNCPIFFKCIVEKPTFNFLWKILRKLAQNEF